MAHITSSSTPLIGHVIEAQRQHSDQHDAETSAHEPMADKDINELNRAFPRRRINWNKFRW